MIRCHFEFSKKCNFEHTGRELCATSNFFQGYLEKKETSKGVFLCLIHLQFHIYNFKQFVQERFFCLSEIQCHVPCGTCLIMVLRLYVVAVLHIIVYVPLRTEVKQKMGAKKDFPIPIDKYPL